MKLQPPDAPLDAFFSPVRRRHPDVDIVVLPTPQTPSEDPVDEAEVAATLDRVASASRRVWEAAPPTAGPPTVGWRFGPLEGTVVAGARADHATPDGVGALAVLGRALVGSGWQVRRLPGEVARVAGARDDLRLQASYAESSGAFVLEVRSEPVFVGAARARRLVRQ